MRAYWWLPEAGGGRIGEMGEGGQKVQMSSDTMRKSWACNVQHGGSS